MAPLMRRRGSEALDRTPSLSRRPPRHPLSPSLARSHASRGRITSGRRRCPTSPVARLRVCVRGARRGQSPGVGVAALQHAADRFLSRCGAGRQRPLWPAGALPSRARGPMYQPSGHRAADALRHSAQHGGERVGAGQRVCGPILEKHSIRGGRSRPTTLSGRRPRAWSGIGVSIPRPARLRRLTARRLTRCTLTICRHGSPRRRLQLARHH